MEIKEIKKELEDITKVPIKSNEVDSKIINKIIELEVKLSKEETKKEILKIIKAWNGYGDDRFPKGEVKELVREIKKL